MTTVEQVRWSIDGTAQAFAPCRILSRRLRRAIGLAGDRAVIAVERDVWPDDVDLDGRIDLRFGDASVSITLGGYVIERVDPGPIGERVGEETETVQEWIVTLVTEPGRYRDGRGGLITEGVYNSLGPGNLPDSEADDYKTVQQLTQIAIDASGFDGTAPEAMNTAVDGATAITPPGPVDWGNARAVPELEDLARYAGWTPAMRLDGSAIDMVRLRRGGESLPIPQTLIDAAEPFEYARTPGLRGSTIVVTSGRTRATRIVSVDIGDLEWVGYDERTGAWLNGTEWETAYPVTGTVRSPDRAVPGDLAVFQEGPDNPLLGSAPGDRRKGFSRIFSALRLTGDDLAERSGFVSIAQQLDADVGSGRPPLGKSGAAFVGRAQTYEPSGKWQTADPNPNDAAEVIYGVVPIAGEGVFRLPPGYIYIKAGGSYSNAEALGAGDADIVFAHESRTGEFVQDYFVRAYRVEANESGVLGATELTGTDLDAAIADPMSVKLEVPWLRLLVLEPDVGDPVQLNGTELAEVAEQLALLKGADSAVQQAVIRIPGFSAINPGSFEGSVTGTTFDLDARRTDLEINGHETPASEFALLESLARRSVANGVQRFSLAGSSVGERDARAGGLPSGGGVGGGEPNASTSERASVGRGRELAEPTRAAMTVPMLESAGEIPMVAQGIRYARVTGSSSTGNGEYTYQVEEISSISQSSALTDGWTGTAKNISEVGNAGRDRKGNGVDVTNLPTGFAFQPVPVGRVVVLHLIEDGWWFDAVTVPDGVCPGGAQ